MRSIYTIIICFLLHSSAFSTGPLRNWGTYFGGLSDEKMGTTYGIGQASAMDASGNVYIVGYTNSNSNMCTPGCYQSIYGGGICDAYIAKFSPSGNLIWATLYGDTGDDYAQGVTVDPSGNVYVCGNTTSSVNISTPGSQQPVYGTGLDGDAFVVKFSSAGVRQWATYYGGSGNDQAYGMATDPVNNRIYVTGGTNSASGIGTPGVFQPTKPSPSSTDYDGFILQLDYSGVRQWGTYFGDSSDEDYVISASFDVASGGFYICGNTSSPSGIATAGAYQTTYAGGYSGDGFLAKFTNTGARTWSTYYGGIGNDNAFCILADASGNAYVCGSTESLNGFGSVGAHQFSCGSNGLPDGFLAKFDPTGARLWGTYYGGNQSDYSMGLAIDPAGYIYMCGSTASGNNIGTAGSYQPNQGSGNYDGFLTLFNPGGGQLWGTYYGGYSLDYGMSVVIDGAGTIYLAGFSNSTNAIATTGSYQPAPDGGYDAFLVQFCKGSASNSIVSGPSMVCPGAVTYSSSATVGVTGYTWTLAGSITGTSTTNVISTTVSGNATISVVFSGLCGTTYATPMSISTNPPATVAVTSPSLICSGQTATLSGTGCYTYTWNTGSNSNSIAVTPSTTTSYTLNGSNFTGCQTSTVVTVSVSPCTEVTTIQKSNALKLYPNPFQSFITLETDEPGELLLYNSSGALLRSYYISDHTAPLLLEDKPPGLYFIRFRGYSEKIVKE